MTPEAGNKAVNLL